MLGLREQYGTTIILVTHAADLAARCDRIVRLRDGQIEGQAQQETAKKATQ